jgi:heme A synthase
VTVEEDRASDRRIAIAFAAVLVVQVVLAAMADAGTYPLWVWLVLAVGAVLVAGLVFAIVNSRAEGTPVWRRPTPRRR